MHLMTVCFIFLLHAVTSSEGNEMTGVAVGVVFALLFVVVLVVLVVIVMIVFVPQSRWRKLSLTNGNTTREGIGE